MIYTTSCIRQNLYINGMPFYENEIPYIHNMLYTINSSNSALKAYPSLNQQVPITIFDKGSILWQN